MASDPDRLTPKQTQAVAALLTGATCQEVATSLGITDRTLRTWKQLPAFAAALQEARQEILDGMIGVLLNMTPKAALTLRNLMDCDEAPTRCRAALGVVDRVIKAFEIKEIVERLAALEGQNAKPGSKAPRRS